MTAASICVSDRRGWFLLKLDSRLAIILLNLVRSTVPAADWCRRHVAAMKRNAGKLRSDPGSTSTLKTEVGNSFETIYGVRLRVFKPKFGLKFIVSTLQSTGVFILLFVGGIMVLHGKTEIGIVVAFISGLDRVLDPGVR